MAELIDNGASFSKFDGILIQTFAHFELPTLEALNGGKVMQGLPPILPMGRLPVFDYKLKEVKQKSQCMIMQWLDDNTKKSYVYLSFGSRTALPKDQIAEISKALEESKYRFVCILKLRKVDKEDREGNLVALLGQEFFDGVKNRGLVIKEWVQQNKILSHCATGAFVSHCGWNSIMKAAERGVPVLVRTLHGDQRVNAEVVVDSGLGVRDKSWELKGKKLVEAYEIVKMLEEVMDGVELRSAELVGEEARRAVADGGSSEAVVKLFVRNGRCSSLICSFKAAASINYNEVILVICPLKSICLIYPNNRTRSATHN